MAEEADAVVGAAPEAGDGGVRAPDAVRAWIGARVDDLDGATVGRVEGFLADARDGAPSWLAIRLGRFGRRTVLPIELTAGAAGRVWTSLRREELRAAPAVDGRASLSAGEERELAAHFGVPAGVGRRARIAGRDGEEPGSVPAGR